MMRSLYPAFALAFLTTACENTALDHPSSPTPSVLGTSSVAKLGAYNADIHQTSVSGISSGGYMAVQMHVAFSSIMKGAGIFAGGPYHCSGSSGSTREALTTCTIASPHAPDVKSLIQVTDQRAAAGSIDATANLSAQKVWLFSGTQDNTVKRPVMDALQQYYQHYLPAANLFYQTDLAAGHAQITDTYGSACGTTQAPYINNCGYDGAGLLFQQIYGALNPRATGTLGGQLIQFDQSQFLGNPGQKGMDTTGWVYVPSACAGNQPCRIHVAFHGCEQYQGKIGSTYYTHAGYNEWADNNNIIVLYPQTVSSNSSPGNPKGCWDWWGYNDGNTYDTRDGDQMAAIKKMIDRLTSGHPALPAPTGLSASAVGDASLTLSWNSVAGAGGYKVYRGTSAGGPFVAVNVTMITGTTYGDSGLSSGTAYYYEVRALDGGGSAGLPSDVLSVTTTGTPPSILPPTGLAASATTTSGISLKWTGATGASGYNLYRSTAADGATTQANGAPVTGIHFTDSGLAASTTYYYVATSLDKAGTESAASTQVSGTTAAASTCYSDNNWNHFVAGRATFCLGNACAVGSGQNMGFLNILYHTTLKKTAPNYYVIGTCP